MGISRAVVVLMAPLLVDATHAQQVGGREEPRPDAKAKADPAAGKPGGGDVSAVLAAASLIADASARAETLVGIAAAQVKAGDRDAARTTLDLARDTAGMIAAVPEKTSRLAQVAHHQAEAGDLDGALRTAGRLGDGFWDGFWKARALAVIARDQARAGDRASAATFRQAIDVARAIPDDRRENVPSKDAMRLDALREVAQAQAEAGDTAGALRTAELCQLSEKDGDWYARDARGRVAVALAERGQVDEGLKLAMTIVEGVSPDQKEFYESERGRTLATMALRLARAGRLAEVPKVVDRIAGAGAKDRAMRDVVMVLAQAGDVDEAARLVVRLPDRSNDRALALAGVARALALRGDVAGAKRSLDEAGAIANIGSGPPGPSLAAQLVLVRVAEVQAMLGDIGGAVRSAEKVGAGEEAAYSPLIELDEPFQHITKKGFALMLISAAQSRAGDVVGATRTAKSIPDDPWSAPWKAYSAARIAAARARAGDGPAAIAEALNQGSPAVTSSALRGITEVLLGVDPPGRPSSPRRP